MRRAIRGYGAGPVLLALAAAGAAGAAPDFEPGYYAVGLSHGAPAFSWFAMDSLGRCGA